MRIDAKTYSALPQRLRRLFALMPNPARAEVLAAFPDAPGQCGPIKYGQELKTDGIYGAMKRGTRPGGFGNVGSERGDPIPNGPQYSDLGSAARFFYCAKASREDRNEGCDGMPSRVISVCGGEQDDLSQGKKATRPSQNIHATVKPTDLMRWLCRLITPKGGLVLDPFAGSGSTGKAAVLEGFSFIGMELSDEYANIAEARIAFALRQGHQPELEAA